MPRSFLRVFMADGARGNSLALKQSARFPRPPRRCSARGKGVLKTNTLTLLMGILQARCDAFNFECRNTSKLLNLSLKIKVRVPGKA